MNAITVVLTDLAILSLLLLIGVFIRVRVSCIQNLYLPVSLIAGFVGLVFGPQILGHFSSCSLPIGKTIAQWPGILVNIVLGLSFFGAASSKNFGRTEFSAVTQGGLVHWLHKSGYMDSRVCVFRCAFMSSGKTWA